MSEHKATGLDGIISKSLKAGAPAICDPLAKVMNASISTSIYINDWNVAKVIPCTSLLMPLRSVTTGQYQFYLFHVKS